MLISADKNTRIDHSGNRGRFLGDGHRGAHRRHTQAGGVIANGHAGAAAEKKGMGNSTPHVHPTPQLPPHLPLLSPTAHTQQHCSYMYCI